MPRVALAVLVIVTACSPAEDTPAPALAAEPRAGLVVNEVAAAGEPHDWFELVNLGPEPIDLSVLVFVDRRDDFLRAHRFADVTLRPGDRHVQPVIRADAGFALGKADGIWIYRFEDRSLIDGVAWRSGGSPRGGSYARIPDGTGAFATVKQPTSGAANQLR